MHNQKLEKVADALGNDTMTHGEKCRDIADSLNLGGGDRDEFLRRSKALNEYKYRRDKWGMLINA